MKSKIKNIQDKGKWESSYGTMYRFELTMESGQVGTALSKSQQFKYKIGDEIEYDFTDGEYPKIKISQPLQQREFKKGGSASFAMSYAKDLVVAGKIEISSLSKYASLILDWLKEND